MIYGEIQMFFSSSLITSRLVHSILSLIKTKSSQSLIDSTMDIKQAVFFGMDRKPGAVLAKQLERNGFGIEVVNSKITERELADNNITYIKTNAASNKDIMLNVQDWCKRSKKHCAVVVLPTPLVLTRTSSELVCYARTLIQDELLGTSRNVWVLFDKTDYELFEAVLSPACDVDKAECIQQQILARNLENIAQYDQRVAAAVRAGTFPEPPRQRVLVIGSGGREHAIVHALTQCPQIEQVYTSPGNFGTGDVSSTATCQCTNVPQMSAEEIVTFVQQHDVSLVIVGPERPLVDGLADHLTVKGVACFGPSARAARIESSKAWSKRFMQRHYLPTAAFEVFTDFEQARKYIESVGYRVVLKASGLAEGKGVLLPATTTETVQAAHSLLVEGVFGDAGREIVIEQFIEGGEEVSVLAFCDGTTAVGMPPAQDHKRALDGDQGLNTGGMGAYAPTPLISPKQYQDCMQIVQRTVTAMAEEGNPFVGVLYAGFMLTTAASVATAVDETEIGTPLLLEYNCRFGDPETQVLLPLLESDLYSICQHCIHGTLQPQHVVWKKDTAACTVVCCSQGYPEPYSTGYPVTGLEKIHELNMHPAVTVYLAGVTSDSSNTTTSTSASDTNKSMEGSADTMLVKTCTPNKSTESILQTITASTSTSSIPVTSGGRVLAVTGLGTNLRNAVENAYLGVKVVHFQGMHYRTDIAKRGLERPLRIGVLGSTNGTSLQPLIDAIQSHTIRATIAVVISNRASAGILQRAKTHHIPSLYLNASGHTREGYDTLVMHTLDSYGVDVVLMVGYMRIVSSVFTSHYPYRCINIHPSLLPAFAGGMDLSVHQSVLDDPFCTETGCTVHFVSEEVDQGEILIQKKCAVDREHDTPQSLKEKVQALEGQALIETVQMFVDGVITTQSGVHHVEFSDSILPSATNQPGHTSSTPDTPTSVPAATATPSSASTHTTHHTTLSGSTYTGYTSSATDVNSTPDSVFQSYTSPGTENKENVKESSVDPYATPDAVPLSYTSPDTATTPYIVTSPPPSPMVEPDTVYSPFDMDRETTTQPPTPYIPYTEQSQYHSTTPHVSFATTTNGTSTQTQPLSTTTSITPDTARRLTYASSGVNIDAGEELVSMIKPHCRSTLRSGCVSGDIGGYGGLFDLSASGYSSADTVLVAGTDGVGTKLRLAIDTGIHSTIGTDLVAMCINDILVCGAEPLFFLDYYATGKLSTTVAAEVVAGIAQGCVAAGCALIGGETAEMPGMYGEGDYDLAGFSVGAVPRDQLLPKPHLMVAGDILIAIRSSGIHSNGYSLVRQCLTQANLSGHSAPPFQSEYATIGEALLVPTHIYGKTLLPVLRQGLVKGLAHITGGGLTHNIPRILPPHLVAVLHAHKNSDNTNYTTPVPALQTTPAATTADTSLSNTQQWTLPPVFAWLQQTAQLSQDDLLSTFNCGIGMVLVVGADQVSEVMQQLQGCTEGAYVVGELRDRMHRQPSGVTAEEEQEEIVYTEPQVEVVSELF